MVIFFSCNKDEEITVDNPETSLPGGQSHMDFKVIEYLPAPGQFINEPASGYDDITTMDQACEYAQSRLGENNFVSLGGWGGYIVVKSSKEIKNSGNYDFSIGSNAFATSNEPGVVWVMKDTNGNGLPDDEWFELKGSEYDKPGYIRDYWITYTKNGVKSDISWVDSEGKTGIIAWLGSFHSQDTYFPIWVADDSYTLHGTLLPSNTFQNPETGDWTTNPFAWGYADNQGEDSKLEEVSGKKILKTYFRVADAVNADGTSVKLDKIDFIKVQTGVNASCGHLGEVSTEVCGFFYE